MTINPRKRFRQTTGKGMLCDKNSASATIFVPDTLFSSCESNKELNTKN